jgi:HAD superfamily hydrolase (TIGR01509 family)
MRRGLLVDFAGTLFLPLNGRQWAQASAARIDARLTPGDVARLGVAIDNRFNRVRYPGRDLSAAAHRQSMLPVMQSLVSDRQLALSLYDLQFTDEFWRLREGALELLRAARRRQHRVAVVSNVPWNIRTLFERAGLVPYIDGFALSFEIGAEKPDRAIFQNALDLIGCAPHEAVLVGDDPITDSGALQLGIPVLLVPGADGQQDPMLGMVATWLGASTY